MCVRVSGGMGWVQQIIIPFIDSIGGRWGRRGGGLLQICDNNIACIATWPLTFPLSFFYSVSILHHLQYSIII